ncbi:hypothetical protein DXT99_13090 [Pontibacter diazotrophicus]|uniref:DUF3311 domain-containing protein n=1 Tax=Pontibacter diazotrophicus TaxID=1400979 RepID=A0A3D8LB86_9BACT|nr:hypothetical protein [Pontibacter diazotrophicus]RDV14603.1 hypothetical protein DXT99_13090 [Pontibacter diazotrophicus]
MQDKVKGRRLFFISVLFLALLSFPVLSIFNKGGMVAGVPVLYLYIMLVWLGCIVAVGLFVERSRTKRETKQ